MPFVGATPRREGVRIDGKIGFSGHPMLRHFEFLRSRTRRTPKVTIPAPSALYGRPALPPIDSGVYPDRDEMFADLGEAYRAAVHAFADAGCRYLQLDEVFLAMLCDPKYREKMVARGDDPSKLVQLYAGLINTAIADAPPDMTVAMHLCRGNFQSTFMGSGGYWAIQEAYSGRSMSMPTSWNMTTNARAASSLCGVCHTESESFSVSLPRSPGTSRARMRSNGALTKLRGLPPRSTLPFGSMRLRVDRRRQYVD